jgi:hypothetical protein
MEVFRRDLVIVTVPVILVAFSVDMDWELVA